ncbi:1-phosphofructokinase family hexose kinase [Sebaldella sp. S0638]|uniref:1-phosphofructokinase family hexose kinase n=1 Tax=Sebaldella sp. S0638 TaxID=2957809 RepID=UPI00209D1DC6|nr:1-phosphofructokinase family hexose kinase [Sebaldella sp. S0638]MCP1222972.1 1-phosphofructokinase family hexose kinase [Sebaldella sp. S0638]
MIYTFTLNTAVDRIIYFEEELERKKNNKISRYIYDVGGKATHVSIILSQLGIDNIATGFIGTEKGEILTELLGKYNVKSEFIVQEGKTRESFILVDNSGKGSFMITEKGFTINEDSYEKITSYMNQKLKNGDVAVFAGSPPPGIDEEKYRKLLRIANEKETKLFIDCSGKFLKTAINENPFLIKPNKDEFEEFISKTGINDENEYIPHMEKLLDSGVKNVLLSLGKDGSMLAMENREIYRIYPPKIKEVNDTGAGDSFVGGVVAGIAKDGDLLEAVKSATAISASKVASGMSSGFDNKEVKEFLKEIKIKKLK